LIYFFSNEFLTDSLGIIATTSLNRTQSFISSTSCVHFRRRTIRRPAKGRHTTRIPRNNIHPFA